MSHLLSAIPLFCLWLLFVGTLTVEDALLGAVLTTLSLYLFRRALGTAWVPEPPPPKPSASQLQRLVALLLFLPLLAWKILGSGMRIAWLGLKPSISFSPGIVRIRPQLPHLSATTALANLITLTPGTLSLEYCQRRDLLFVHWIHMSKGEEEAIDRQVTSGMRPWIGRIFG